MSTPVITIFVRHGVSKDGLPCKYAGDEFSRRCNCRKHLRWTLNGKQYRKQAGTRSWEEAEEKKRELSDQLGGKVPETQPEARLLQECIRLFLTDKNTQGIEPNTLAKYKLALERLRAYCEVQGVYAIHGVTRELLTGFAATWASEYPSSNTRLQVRGRLRSFFGYCFDAQWMPRIPALAKVRVDEPPTMPLTAEEYTRLLDAVYAVVTKPDMQKKVHALFQLMRWSGLALRDALTLERTEIQWDAVQRIHRIVTARQKTGVHVSVPIPPNVAEELLQVPNSSERYIFWSGNGREESAVQMWATAYFKPIFAAAKIPDVCNMRSHRLRDTFAVDLLTKGVPLEEVSKLLGHESIKTTERHYSKWIKGRQDRLDSLVMGTWAKPKRKR